MPPEELDVLIIGAGLSGIGCAWYLQNRLQGTAYAILEARDSIGGTWDLFRYPGVRSDSDLYTFGYEFKPWRSRKSIADAASIKVYVEEAARENGIDRHIRFRHRVVAANWCGSSGRWELRVQRVDTGEELHLRCRWLFAAGGYYRYEEGFTPQFEGQERFRGRIVHPQQWPKDLDWAGKQVLVIGSGATAVTLVPAMAETATHVVMLQRTPSYILPMPSEDPMARLLKHLLGQDRSHAWVRRKNIALQQWIYAFCQKYPHAARRVIRRINASVLPKGYPVDLHFSPPYNPWDQRMCIAPDGDLFAAIRSGRASVETDAICAFTESGVRLQSGRELHADIIVTATGLSLQPFGGFELCVDGSPVELRRTVAFKGMMLSGVPNLAFAIGYTSSSWTLKVGLLCEHFCRLLLYMQDKGYDTCVPVADPAMPTRPLLDFGAGYVKRSLTDLPRQGHAYPWLMSMNYASDKRLFRRGEVADRHLRFGTVVQGPTSAG